MAANVWTMIALAAGSARSGATRDRIMAAFTRLLFAGGFDSVSVRAVVASAGVARSTFYEHFSSKEDVLRACMGRFFTVIARCAREDSPPPELPAVLEHLWSNRRLNDAIFSGQAGAILHRTHADLVERQLLDLAGYAPLRLPSRLAAIQLAEAQLGLVEAWLRGRAWCDVAELAAGLHASSRAAALACLDGSPR